MHEFQRTMKTQWLQLLIRGVICLSGWRAQPWTTHAVLYSCLSGRFAIWYRQIVRSPKEADVTITEKVY